MRINSSLHPTDTILWPALEKLLFHYPEINVEIANDHGLVDIVAQGYDSGVRLGEQVAHDMIAVRIGPDLRVAVWERPAIARTVGPARAAGSDGPRLHRSEVPTLGGLHVCELEKDGRELRARVQDRLTFKEAPVILAAAAGFSLACLPEDHVRPMMNDGRLERVLADWCPPFPEYRLYFPSRRQAFPAFALVVDALRQTA